MIKYYTTLNRNLRILRRNISKAVSQSTKRVYCLLKATGDGYFTLKPHQEYRWRADDENFNSFTATDVLCSCIITGSWGFRRRRNDKDGEFRFQPVYQAADQSPGKKLPRIIGKLDDFLVKECSTKCAVSGVRHDRANVADPSLIDHLRGRTWRRTSQMEYRWAECFTQRKNIFFLIRDYLRGACTNLEILGDGFREFNGIPRSFYSKKFGMYILLVGSEGKIFRVIDF